MQPAGSTASSRASLAILVAGLLVGLALGLVVFYGLPSVTPGNLSSLVRPGGPTTTPAPAPVVGAPAPDFSLNDLPGNSVTLASFRGRVVLLNFWATWCGPCRIEMPAIERRYQQYKDQGFVVLAVDADEPATDVSAFTHAYNLSFTMLLDPGMVVNDLYRVRGYPTSYFVDRTGYIKVLHIGSMTEAQLDGYLKNLGLGE